MEKDTRVIIECIYFTYYYYKNLVVYRITELQQPCFLSHSCMLYIKKVVQIKKNRFLAKNASTLMT